ncbi:hypothetical protein [Scandinavium sp.]|uniref:hypothetical protein n=1 Tax=Scandinavium sp. TaxID=2830653 RepID=UPI0028A1BA88|nr:hypothetical protein [Scandinavium sp.]
MKKDIALSIMVGSVLTAGMIAPVSAADAENVANKIENKAPTNSGKCASGKCGTEKIYGQANLKHDPQDQLVRARDGKCGMTGEGVKNQESPQQVNHGKCVSGVCGK